MLLFGHYQQALALLSETIKDQGLVQKKQNDKRKLKQKLTAHLHVDETVNASLKELCSKIVQLIACTESDSDTPVILAAISSLEVISRELPSDDLTFSSSLACVVEYIASADLAISSACLRSTGTIINVLGSKALTHLPNVMKHLLEKAHEISICQVGKYGHLKISKQNLDDKVPLILAIIMALEAVIENLGGFLNPYLEDILDLIVLHPEYAVELDAKMKQKAATVRKLLTEKIPVCFLLA